MCCSICHKTNHNKTTCPTRNAAEGQHEYSTTRVEGQYGHATPMAEGQHRHAILGASIPSTEQRPLIEQHG